MKTPLLRLHLHGLDALFSVLSSAERVGIEVCRMTGFNRRRRGSVCLNGTRRGNR